METDFFFNVSTTVKHDTHISGLQDKVHVFMLHGFQPSTVCREVLVFLILELRFVQISWVLYLLYGAHSKEVIKCIAINSLETRRWHMLVPTPHSLFGCTRKLRLHCLQRTVHTAVENQRNNGAFPTRVDSQPNKNENHSWTGKITRKIRFARTDLWTDNKCMKVIAVFTWHGGLFFARTGVSTTEKTYADTGRGNVNHCCWTQTCLVG